MLAGMDPMNRKPQATGTGCGSARSASILVILPHNQGDVVMALQAIRMVKAERPGLEVDYLVSDECRELVMGSPLLRQVHVLPKDSLPRLRENGNEAGLPNDLDAFLSGLAATSYDLSLNLFQEKPGAILQSRVRAERKAGLERIGGKDLRVRSRFMEHLFAIPADRRGNAWHAVDIYVRAARRALESISSLATPGKSGLPPWGVGAGAGAGPAAIFPSPPRPEVCASLAAGEYLVFHAGSAWPGKRWPAAHWALLANRCAGAGFTMVFTGSPGEKPLMDRIVENMDGPARKASLDCVGRTDLPGVAWICAHARMVVTGDTMAMHLAAASGTPTLCLFGASNPVETGPYGKGHVILQTEPAPPPNLAFDREHPGLANLSPMEVADYLLEGVPPPGFPLWETCWDGERNRQTLRDYHGLPPPGSQRALRLMEVLDRLADREDPGGINPLPKPGGPAENLRGLLITAVDALSDAPATAPERLLAGVEDAERELSRETENDLVWEAYRIAVNGLPIDDMRVHLTARLNRLDRAIKEETLRNP